MFLIDGQGPQDAHGGPDQRTTYTGRNDPANELAWPGRPASLQECLSLTDTDSALDFTLDDAAESSATKVFVLLR